MQGSGYVGSTCHVGLGSRFTDNGDGTVTDALTTLVWEKKDNLDSTVDYSDPHDADNTYTWSSGPSSSVEDGTVFTTSFSPAVPGFLTNSMTSLNVAGFAGASGWRLPTLAELQTIVLDFPCTKKSVSCDCVVSPCIPSTFGPPPPHGFGPTQPSQYWSSTSYLPYSRNAWSVSFDDGSVTAVFLFKNAGVYVRAVRGGF